MSSLQSILKRIQVQCLRRCAHPEHRVRGRNTSVQPGEALRKMKAGCLASSLLMRRR